MHHFMVSYSLFGYNYYYMCESGETHPYIYYIVHVHTTEALLLELKGFSIDIIFKRF